MHSSHRFAKGFTLMEMTLVVGLFAVLVAGTGISLSRFFTQSQLQEYGVQVTQSLRRAQTSALAGYYNSDWGVALQAADHQVTLFRGSSFTGRNPAFDERIALPSLLEVEAISLAGGGSEIIFNRVTGVTNQSGSFQLRESTTNQILTIIINRYGQVETSS